MKRQALDQFFAEVQKDHLIPLWDAAPHILFPQPRTHVVPYLWKGSMLKDRLLEAGKLITPNESGDSSRRVLMLENPGLREQGIVASTTQTLSIALQIIFPGETASAHRHSQTAFRFILHGEGAYTTVEGERVPMKEGDFLLTERYCWHEHAHEGSEMMYWLDGLDIPFVKAINATFFEKHPDEMQKVTVPDGHSNRRYADGMLRPIADRKKRDYPSPVAAYPMGKTLKALQSLDELNEVDAYDGVAMEYVNPANGGTANQNIGHWMQMLRPKQHTKAHRHVHSAVYVVHEGRGYSIINGERFDWEKGDIFVVPTWAWHEHVNTSDSNPAYLFSINDLPVFEKHNLEREEVYPDHNGYQLIEKIFS